MDQEKIGKFIAECRKKQNLTQLQLADKLSITNRAVSKWETGKAMPDSSIMLELCDTLGITVNDLLSGEVVTMDHYSKETEQNLLDMIKAKEQSDKRLLAAEGLLIVLSIIILLIPFLIAVHLPLENWQKILLVLSGLIPALIGLGFAMKIEQIAGYYACKACGHRYVPSFRATIFAPHMGRTKYLRCPACGKKSWQKKVLTK